MDKLAIEEALLRTQLQQQQQEAVPGGPADTQAVAVAGATPAAAGAPQSPLFFGSKRGGRLAVVSVPAGAPSRVSGPASSQERKFKFVSLLLLLRVTCCVAAWHMRSHDKLGCVVVLWTCHTSCWQLAWLD